MILFVGDGMGISTITAGRIYRGQQLGGTGEEHVLAFETFENVALVKTYNTDMQVPDSAGTMTAIVTGEKTRAGVLSVGADVERGDCEAALANPLRTLFEIAVEHGLRTGVVTTTTVTHATPAAGYAHAPDRDWEADSNVPEEAKLAGCRDIAQQLIDFNEGKGIDVVLGGGRQNFRPVSAVDPEYADQYGKRNDETDLIAHWQKEAPNRQFVWNLEQFNALRPDTPDQVLGLFEPSHMKFEADRADDAGGEPSLAEMTRFAINKFANSRHGYLLVVEGGRIDHAHHFGNAYRAMTDMTALDDAVQVAKDLTDPEDTLILVTADHSHTLTIAGYPPRGNPILGTVPIPQAYAGFMKPYTTLTYANGPGYKQPPADLSEADTQAKDYRQAAAVALPVETHAGEDVAAYAQGPNASALRGVIEQNRIFDVLYGALFREPTADNQITTQEDVR
ncbi:MAG: alkaline phosphatase [Proteobacteria bacterium]|nr:alkaline phosphatase [Pseudomonadota bacterium]